MKIQLYVNMFIHSMDLQLSQRLTHSFLSDIIVLKIIVGFLSNISEVFRIRIYLYSIDTITFIMQRFLVKQEIDISRLDT